MLDQGKILLGRGQTPVWMLPGMANRHGLIAGATGTGKTVTVRVLAEGLPGVKRVETDFTAPPPFLLGAR